MNNSRREVGAVKVVLTYGTFDLLHIGHINLFSRLKSMGDRLIVGVSTDSFNHRKGKENVMPFEHRLKIVSSLSYVDMVFPEEDWEQKKYDIIKYEVSLFAMGDDWKGCFDDLVNYCEVVYLPRTEGISSSGIKKVLNNKQGIL